MIETPTARDDKCIFAEGSHGHIARGLPVPQSWGTLTVKASHGNLRTAAEIRGDLQDLAHKRVRRTTKPKASWCGTIWTLNQQIKASFQDEALIHFNV